MVGGAASAWGYRRIDGLCPGAARQKALTCRVCRERPDLLCPKVPARPQPVAVIPPAEIASKATEATNLLVTLSTKYISGSQIDKIQKPFYEMSHQIEQEYDDVSMTLQENPTLATLQNLHEVWHARRERIDAWLQLLTERPWT